MLWASAGDAASIAPVANKAMVMEVEDMHVPFTTRTERDGATFRARGATLWTKRLCRSLDGACSLNGPCRPR